MSYLSDSLQWEQDVRRFLRSHPLDQASANNLINDVGTVVVPNKTAYDALRVFAPLRPNVFLRGTQMPREHTADW